MVELVGLLAAVTLTATPAVEARRTAGQDLEPAPTVRTSLQTMVRFGSGDGTSNLFFSNPDPMASTMASFVAHAHLGSDEGWSGSVSVPVGSAAGGVILGNVRLGGGWGGVWGDPGATARGGLAFGVDLYLPTAVGSEVLGGNLDPELLSTLHAYEPQLFFANRWAVRGRVHGTLEIGDFRSDAEIAFTAGLAANERGSGSEWFNALFEVGYTRWGWIQPFIGTEATLRLTPTEGTFAGQAVFRSTPLTQSIPPRLNLGASFAHGAFRARLFGQLVFDEDDYGSEVLIESSGNFVDVNGEEIPVTRDGRIFDSSPFAPGADDGSGLDARIGLELGLAFDAL